MLARYEIRIAGQLDATAAAAFAGLSIAASGGITALRGDFDQAGLQGLLERIRALGLDLVDARRVRMPADGRTDGALGRTGSPLPDDPDGPGCCDDG